MIFRAPLPFTEALQAREVRSILPTDFRTRLLREVLPQLKERATFSAGVTNVEFLQRIDDSINDLVSGRVDRATKRAELKQLLDSLQYQPAPGEEGTLTDLSSDARLNLILDTNYEMATGYGHFIQGQEPEVLDQWPAQELIRVTSGKTQRDWAARWVQAGGEFVDGQRMVDLKTSPVWVRLGDPSEFDDGLGNPYPPFAFNSGMDVRDVDRTEAIALGLIDRDTPLFPQSRGFNQDLQATPEVRAGALQAALLENLRDQGIAAEFVGGVLRYVGGRG